MNDNKRYYWIKLKTDFFNQETVDFLLSQKNGCEYIVLYQMLCLNTANNNGEMCSKIGEMIVPYNVDKIVRDTKYFAILNATTFLQATLAFKIFDNVGCANPIISLAIVWLIFIGTSVLKIYISTPPIPYNYNATLFYL